MCWVSRKCFVCVLCHNVSHVSQFLLRLALAQTCPRCRGLNDITESNCWVCWFRIDDAIDGTVYHARNAPGATVDAVKSSQDSKEAAKGD